MFTPLQYSTVGLSEEMAVDKHGVDSIEVSKSDFLLDIVICVFSVFAIVLEPET